MAEYKPRYAVVKADGWTENLNDISYFGILSRLGRDTHNRWTLLLRDGNVVETKISEKAWAFVKGYDDAVSAALADLKAKGRPDWLPEGEE